MILYFNVTIMIMCFINVSLQQTINKDDLKEGSYQFLDLVDNQTLIRKVKTRQIRDDIPMGHLVIGGKLAKPSEFPHMALMFYGDVINDNNWTCGGVLINERYILTSAQCVNSPKQSEMKLRYSARWARLGAVTTDTNSDQSHTQDYRIVHHFVYPYFVLPYYNIGLFGLEKNVQFTKYIKPISLNQDTLLNPKRFTSTFWERTTHGSSSSFTDLLKLEVNYIPPKQCNETYAALTQQNYLKYGILNDTMICTSWIKRKNNFCQRDSGGPIQIDNVDKPGTYTLLGFISFGQYCGDSKPDVYTNITLFVPWIQSIIMPKQCVGFECKTPGYYRFRF